MEAWENKEEFKAKVYQIALKMDVKIHILAFRPMKNKWASFSTNGNLNINTELLSMDKKLGEYVIVHELLHFNIPNHGKLWKSLMIAYLGDYEELENQLKDAAKQNKLPIFE